MLVILLGLLCIVIAIWLVPLWLLPWVVGIGVLVWAYYCVVKSGYPLWPTVAWAVPVATAMLVGTLVHSPWARVIGWLGLASWLALYALEPARRFWYVRLFHWRPGSN